MRRASSELNAFLGARHEERGFVGETMKSLEVEVPAVHNVDGASLDQQVVEKGDIRAFSLSNLHNRRDQPAQIHLRVQFDGGIATAIVRPREHGETQIDDRGVERVHGISEVDGERFVHVEVARGPNEASREVGVDAPVAGLVRLGQRRPRDARADAHVIELRLYGAKTRFDIPQALAIGELRERHAEILIPAREARRLTVPVVSRDARLKLVLRHMGHQLSEHAAASRHTSFWWPGLSRLFCPEDARSRKTSSGRKMARISLGISSLERFANAMTGQKWWSSHISGMIL